MDVLEKLEAALTGFYGQRSWLIAVDVVASYRGLWTDLARLGAKDCFVVAARLGTGDLPEEDVQWCCLDLPPAHDLMEAIHGADRALRELPSQVQQAIDAFDPDRRMASIGAFFSEGSPVAGRDMVGRRPLHWQALEDKVAIDAVWDAAGVTRAPSETVAVDLGELVAAAARLDRGDGTVWAGDAREGFNGGAARTHWVVTSDEQRAAFQALRPHCDQARVMPFLEGIPCSIHGLVLPDGTAVFRPAEMLVLRNARQFVYARAAMYWDPPRPDRERMRAVARRVGEHLRQTVDYRGAFTVDGVLTAHGFLPTELNPRVGAAMGMLTPSVSMSLLHFAVIEGVDIGVSAAELESVVLSQADVYRSGHFGFSVTQLLEPSEHALRWAVDRWTEASDTADLHVRVGSGPTGGFVNARPVAENMPVGPSFAPRVAAFADWADAHLGTHIGPLTPARSPS
jgi:hypothetical protein